MPVSSLPVLAAAALAIGITFGLGAHHYLYGRNSATVAEVKPLFARSVEQAELSASRWPAERLDVPFYGPMVELLTLGASVSHVSTTDHHHQQPQLAAEPQTGRATTGGDQPRRQVRQSRRANGERKDDGRSTEVNPSDAYARGDSLPQPRGSSRPEDNNRDGRRSDRGVNGVPPGAEDRSTWDRRRRDEQRSREPESRASVRQEDRDRRAAPASEGFTPFRLFGIFDSR
jgi:hypothetical protein